MRQVVLDTETTGLEPDQGHRVIEIGAVEVSARRLSGRHFHRYLNPHRDIDDAAIEVHGITTEFLSDKPDFEDVAKEFLGFIDGADLVIHNAGFDVSFLDRELSLLDPVPGRIADFCTVTDSLALARHKHPGQKNNLDALCRRYGIDNSQRDLHGALLDAEILADVYLTMTGGQTTLFDDPRELRSERPEALPEIISGPLPELLVVRATAQELDAHERRLVALERESEHGCVWRRLAASGHSEQQAQPPRVIGD